MHIHTQNTPSHLSNIISTLIQYDVINSTRDLFPIQQHPWLPYRSAGKNHYSKRWRRRRNADHRCKNRQMLDTLLLTVYCPFKLPSSPLLIPVSSLLVRVTTRHKRPLHSNRNSEIHTFWSGPDRANDAQYSHQRLSNDHPRQDTHPGRQWRGRVWNVGRKSVISI